SWRGLRGVRSARNAKSRARKPRDEPSIRNDGEVVEVRVSEQHVFDADATVGVAVRILVRGDPGGVQEDGERLTDGFDTDDVSRGGVVDVHDCGRAERDELVDGDAAKSQA